MARINLRKFIAEHYKGGVNARDVIREALTNSIHAGGKMITVDLHFSEKQQELSLGSEERSVLEQITITDDGEGFTSENLNFFDEICTSHKDSIGGKGVGRLAFLKYANEVQISSQLANELVEFWYTPDFKPDDVKKFAKQGVASTCITLSALKEKINTQVAKLVNSICDDLRLLLFLKHQAGQSITLKFTHNSRQPFDEVHVFSGGSIKAELTREFEFQGEKFKCYLFRDEPPKKGIVAMLCADELCIEEYVISKRFGICRHLIFVTSDYFNKRSNIERQSLELPKTDDDADMVSPISREKLMPRIHEECMAMINESAEGDIEQFKTDNIEKLKKYYPFINIESLNGDAALLDADEVIKAYRAQQARKEDQVVEALESGKPVSWDDVSHLASEDLARYIVHRALVIDSLAKMPAESTEDAIHNAILPKKSNGSEIRENNVWLVDDKFLSYSSIYSDQTLTTIVKEVGDSVESKQQRRPDVAAFFSKDSENHPNKLVIIEFKKPGADIFDNNKALMQCRLYASELAARIPTVREVFAFSIVEIDDEFYRDMKQTGFKDVFSLTERVEHIQRLDTRNTRAWQLRYGKWKTFSDHTADGSGAAAALAAAIDELRRRIERLPAPTGLRQENSSSKNSDLPVGVSGPIARTRKGRRVAEYNFGVTVPRFGDKPTNKNVYIGTENTITDERYEEALARAVDIRKKAERAYQAAATKAKRAALSLKGRTKP